MPVTIFEYDFTDYINKMHLSKTVKPAGHYKVALTLNDKVLDALEKSKDKDFLGLRMKEKAQKVCEKAAVELVTKWKELDAELEGMRKLNKLTDEMAKSRVAAFGEVVKKKVAEVKVQLGKLPEEQWKKFLAKYGKAKKEYQNYQVGAGVDVALGTLGVIGGIAAAVGTHGAGLALAIIPIIRSAVKVGETVYMIAIDVKKLVDDLKVSIEKMKDEFTASSKKAKAAAAGKDLAKSLLNTVVGGQFIDTVSNVGKKTETASGKASGAYLGGVRLSREVTEALNQMQKLEQKLASGGGKKPEKTLKELTKLQGGFDKLFGKAADLNAKAQQVEKDLKAIKTQLKVLQANTTELAIAEKVINVLANVAIAAAGAGVNLAGAGKEVLEITKESVNLTRELATSVKEELV
jgi:hypothetical protein